MVKHYGFKNVMSPVKNTCELIIPETLVPIENPIGHLHRPARSIFKKRAARLLYAGFPHRVHGGHIGPTGVTFGEAPARQPATFWPRCHYRNDQRGPGVKSISDITLSNGLFGPVFQDIRNIRANSGKFWRLSAQNIYG